MCDCGNREQIRELTAKTVCNTNESQMIVLCSLKCDVESMIAYLTLLRRAVNSNANNYVQN